ncbi:MAG: restriction endonuclease subunit S, partial [Chloroflexota bacterium]
FSRFLLYLVLSDNFTKFTVQKSMRVAMPKINRDDLNNECYIALPPTLQEQQATATYLDQETAKIDALIEKTQATIERLKEYRTALISAAVTGKIDVRQEVAA